MKVLSSSHCTNSFQRCLTKGSQLPVCWRKTLGALLWDKVVLLPACLVNHTFAVIICFLPLLIFFVTRNSLCYPQGKCLGASSDCDTGRSLDPVITASKIQPHSSTAGASDKSRCETSHVWLSFTVFFFFFNCKIAVTLLSRQLRWHRSIMIAVVFCYKSPLNLALTSDFLSLHVKVAFGTK